MTNLIRKLRDEQHISTTELARRLGKTQSLIPKMEQSENTEGIKLVSLRRAVEALDAELIVRAERRSRLTVTPTSRVGMTRPDARYSYELHRLIAIKLLGNPEEALRVVPKNLAASRRKVNGSQPREWLDEWEVLCSGPVNELVGAMLAETEHGINMRQVTPFAGVLTDEERHSASARTQVT